MQRSQQIALMANYNEWMNQKVYQAAGKLSAAELAQDRQAFFGSILGTLNHILVGDLIWLKRFAAHPANFAALLPVQQMVIPTELNQQPYSDLASLAAQRVQLDQLIKTWVASISEAELDQALPYQTLAGEPLQKNLYALLTHFFNHQTHHRGQVSTLLFQAGVDIGETDLNAIIPVLE